MPRPKGSLNKKSSSSGGLQVLKFDKQIEGAPITKVNTSYNFVQWGKNNNFPELLLDLYNNSPVHHSAIDFEVQAVVGDGIDAEAMKLDNTQLYANYYQSWDAILRNITLDYFIFGCFALQIIKNRDNKTYSFYHFPMDKVRMTEFDEDGVITKYAISKDWNNLSQNSPMFIDAFDFRDESVLKQGTPYLYVYHSYSPTQDYYSSPQYQAAIQAIQADVQYCEYDLKTVTNNFTPAGMIVMNSVETDEEKREVVQNIERMFNGAKNAASVMVTFRDNPEQLAPEFIPFTASVNNVNLYDASNVRNINRILCAHHINDAALIGLPSIGSTGFASEADKLETAFQLYEKVSGNYHRKCIVNSINDALKLNGLDVQIILKPLKFNDFGTEENSVTEDNGKADEVNQDVTTNNIEEQTNGGNN